MRQIESHIISNNHKSFKFIDEQSILSKKLFNATMNYINNIYETENRYCNYFEVNKKFVELNQLEYRVLSSNVAQQVLMQVDRCWKSYLKALTEFKKDSSKFKGEPKPPRTKDKEWQRNILTYTQRVISAPALRNGKIVLFKHDIYITTELRNINQVTIVPLPTGQYKVILIYEKELEKKIESDVLAGGDIGVNNLITVGFNDNKIQPFIISGRPLKSINQFYHKRIAQLKKKLPEKRKTSKKIRKITHKHNMKVNDYIHKSSRIITNILKENNTSKLVIGYNPEWKQHVNLGSKTNQNFVSIPFFKMINAISYKNELAGIETVVREESYTSKASFLDGDYSRKKSSYSGKRVKRGLYISAKGIKINADLNSAYNILKKEIPNAFANGIEGVVVHPSMINIVK